MEGLRMCMIQAVYLTIYHSSVRMTSTTEVLSTVVRKSSIFWDVAIQMIYVKKKRFVFNISKGKVVPVLN
jgi:hypothetical protein